MHATPCNGSTPAPTRKLNNVSVNAGRPRRETSFHSRCWGGGAASTQERFISGERERAEQLTTWRVQRTAATSTTATRAPSASLRHPRAVSNGRRGRKGIEKKNPFVAKELAQQREQAQVGWRCSADSHSARDCIHPDCFYARRREAPLLLFAAAGLRYGWRAPGLCPKRLG